MADDTPVVLAGGVPVAASLARQANVGSSGGYGEGGDGSGGEADGSNQPGSKKKKGKKRGRPVSIPELPQSRQERRLSKSKARKLASLEVRGGARGPRVTVLATHGLHGRGTACRRTG